MSELSAGLSAQWLALREPADAAARATDLVDEIAREAGPGRTVVHDLGCGTGSMLRWLAPRLAGPQHWVMYDRDATLLAQAGEGIPPTARDGSAITAETRQRDITRLDRAELADSSLITASALLDLLTLDELGRMVTACVTAGCTTLLTLSVIGRIELAPSEPLDEAISAAFNAHQCRTVARGRLLGPAAASVAGQLFTLAGAEVHRRASPWRLDAADSALTIEWLRGWVAAACEARPELTDPAVGYLSRRLALAADRRLQATVHHDDLLVHRR